MRIPSSSANSTDPAITKENAMKQVKRNAGRPTFNCPQTNLQYVGTLGDYIR